MSTAELSDRTAPAPAVIDIEASGFGRGSYPIEIGFVLPDGETDCMLIRPLATWHHWDPAAESLHHISRDMIERFGQPVSAVIDRLEARLAGRTVYSDGWGHDYSWLAALYEAADRSVGFRLESLQTLLSEDEMTAWDRTKDAVVRDAALERHRASADARVLQSTLMRLRADASRG
jgi:peptidoglycan/xylan/chitin deacetylase (PgdA/CDA1 family)